MKDKKRIEILLNVIKRLRWKSLPTRDNRLVDGGGMRWGMCMSWTGIFILLFFAVIFIIMTILEKKPKQECWRHRFLVWEKTAFRNSRVI